jgi:hypothetical protein
MRNPSCNRDPDAAEHLSAARLHHGRGVLLEIVAERIIRGDEEPGIVPGLDHGAAGAVRERVIVVGVVHRDRRAGLVGDAHGGGTVEHDDLVLGLGDVDRGKRGRGGRDVHQRIDVLGVEPFPRDRRGDVRFVLMVGVDHFDRLAEHFPAEILGRHPGRGHRADAGDVRIEARHVLDHADLDRAVGYLVLAVSGRGCHRQRRGGKHCGFVHGFLPVVRAAGSS